MNETQISMFMGETKATMTALTTSLRELKDSVRDLVHQFESNAKEVREALVPLNDYGHDIENHEKRICALEKITQEHEATIRDARSRIAAWMAMGGLMATGIVWAANRLWK